MSSSDPLNTSFDIAFIVMCVLASGCSFESPQIPDTSTNSPNVISDASPSADANLSDSGTVVVDAQQPPSPIFLNSDPFAEEVNSSDVNIHFSLSDFTQAKTEYGVTPNLTMFTTEELSFDHKDHRQRIRDLISGTSYSFRIHATDRDDNTFISETFSFTKE